MAEARRYRANGSRFTTDTKTVIVTMLRMRPTKSLAYISSKAGISERTLRLWRERGNKNWHDVEDALDRGELARLDEYGEFARACKEAETESIEGDTKQGEIQSPVAMIWKAAEHDSRAAMWIVDRVQMRAGAGSNAQGEAIDAPDTKGARDRLFARVQAIVDHADA